MNLSRSTYYHKPKIEADDQNLVQEIETIIEELSGYGYRRVTQELHRRGKPVNHKKVHRIMKERGLLKKPKRRWIRTTDSNHGHRVYPNLMQNLAVTDILDRLDAANEIRDMSYPGSGLHLLEPKKDGRWAVKVSANWRITFCFREGDAYDVDYEDYH